MAEGRVAGDLGPARVAQVDTQRQFAVTAAMAGQLEEGWRLSRASLGALSAPPGGWDGVAICGMGGSAIGGDVVAACLPESPVPLQVVRGYELPGWAGRRTLVTAVSYSGDTEETLACTADALRRECRLVGVTSGGELGRLAGEHSLPVVVVPPGMQPRSALGLLSSALAGILQRAGLAGGIDAQLEEAGAVVRDLVARLAPDVPDEVNGAKRLARTLEQRVPVLYGAGLAAVAARRFKCQLNEYANALAFWGELPELNHNEFVGWSGTDQAAGRFHAVLLDDALAAAPVRRRLALTRELVARHAGGVDVLESTGTSPLARLLSLAYVGDWTALYLALLRGLDPAPVAVIDWLKRRMAGEDAPLPDAAAVSGRIDAADG
jgi:glucose/mannose-6-phosphate isomerase